VVKRWAGATAALVATVAVAVPGIGDARAARPEIHVGAAVSGRPLHVTGTSPRRAPVRLQHRVGGRWVTDATVRATASGRYDVAVTATLGATRYRVRAGAAVSRAVTVSPRPAVTTVAGTTGTGTPGTTGTTGTTGTDATPTRTVLVTGRLPSLGHTAGPRRPVLLQRRSGARWVTVASTRARATFGLRWSNATSAVVRVQAPALPRTRHRARIAAVVSATATVAAPSSAGHPTSPTSPTPPTSTPGDPTTPGPLDTPGTRDLTPGVGQESGEPHLSGDGSVVAFSSAARLVPADANDVTDVYLVTVATGAYELISADPVTGAALGAGQPAISGNGRMVAFVSAATPTGLPAQTTRQVYLHDRTTGQTEMVSGGAAHTPNGMAGSPSLDHDGTRIVFQSAATNIADLFAPVSDTNGGYDVFLYNRVLRTTELVSHTNSSSSNAGDQASWDPQISRNGAAIVFTSRAQNLGSNAAPGITQVWLTEPKGGASYLITGASGPADHDASDPSIGGSGVPWAITFVSAATNLGTANPLGQPQVYRWVGYADLSGGTLDPVSTHVGGEFHTNGVAPVISLDGETIAYTPWIGSAGRVYRWRVGDRYDLVSRTPGALAPDGDSYAVTLSDDSALLAYVSAAPDIDAEHAVPGVPHLFLTRLAAS
jgi:hypothetical protein